MSDKEVKSTHDDSSASGAVTPAGGSNHKRPADKKGVGDKKADKTKADVKASVVTFGKVNKEEFISLFSGLDLSEDFNEKAFNLYEAAVLESVQSVVDAVEEAKTEELEQYKEEFEEKLSDFIDLFATQYMKENELAIENGLKAAAAESLLNGMKDLFFEHNIEIPEDKVDIVESLTQEVSELQEKLNSQLAENVDLNKKLFANSKNEILSEMLQGVDDVSASRVKRLAESLTDKNAEDFKSTISTFLEAISNKKTAEPKSIVEDSAAVEVKDEPSIDPVVASLMKTL